MGSCPYPRNGIIKIDYEYILIFKKLGNPPKVSKETKELSKLSTEEWNTYFASHWNFGGEKQDKHLAMFPEELPRRLIRMFSFVGDTVLDPFLGSGTTSLAAKNLSRNSVGYEINPKFVPIIKHKLKVSEQDIFGNVTYEFVNQKPSEDDLSKRIQSLPYRFCDPHNLDKKIDPRKLKFGSRIEEGDDEAGARLYSVREVISPEILKLDTGVSVRLLGVAEQSSHREQAIAFLIEMMRGQKVFLKFDKDKYDDAGNLLSYVYLRNKTFINAHLIRTRLVSVDNKRDYKYRYKFQNVLR
jgi:site-specific DNA-methyltransferase (adenine-specific)